MLYAFSGLKGCGKNTAANVLVKEFGFIEAAFADKLREAALALNPLMWTSFDLFGEEMGVYLQDIISDWGWDYSKRRYPGVRRILQRLGTEMGRNVFGENFWVNQLANTQDDWASRLSRYVISDARFPNEGAWIHEQQGTLIWIDRDELESDGHASESTVLRDTANYIIENNGTKDEFENKIRLLVGSQLKYYSTSN